jgi:hypothetical protein
MKPLTEPVPFSLETDKRHELHQAALIEKLQKEEYESYLKKQFVAQPLMDVEPFVPKPSDKAPVQPEPITLNT